MLSTRVKCPVCFSKPRPPTSMCSMGHIVCCLCRPKLTQCPTCRGAFATLKNTTFDQLLEELHFPCKGEKHGCKQQLPFKNLAAHESECYHCKELTCNVCKVSIPCNFMQQHVSTQHAQLITYSAQFPVKVTFGLYMNDWSRTNKVIFKAVKSTGSLLEFHLKADNDKLLLGVKRYDSFNNEHSVTTSTKYGRNELKIITNTKGGSIKETDLWKAPNFVIDRQLATLFFQEGRLTIECITEKV